MIPGVSAEEQRDLILSVGTHQGQRRLSPGQVAELLGSATASGATRRSLSEALGLRDTSMIGRFLKLNALPPGARDLVGWGRNPEELSLSVAAEIASAPAQARDELIAAAQAHRLTKEEARAVVQRLDRSGDSPAQAVEVIVALRSETVRRYVFLGRLELPKLRRELVLRSHEERQLLFAEVLEALGVDAAGALRPNGFSLSREREPFSDADKLEGDVEAELARRVGV